MTAKGQQVFKEKQLNRLQNDYETIALLFAFLQQIVVCFEIFHIWSLGFGGEDPL